MNNNILFGALAAILVSTTLTFSAFAHVSDQQRYNDGYNTGQEYAACDYSNCYHSNHGYDTGCPNGKKHTYEFCQGYSLGYKTRWNSLAGETSAQQQSQIQAQIVNFKKKRKIPFQDFSRFWVAVVCWILLQLNYYHRLRQCVYVPGRGCKCYRRLHCRQHRHWHLRH